VGHHGDRETTAAAMVAGECILPLSWNARNRKGLSQLRANDGCVLLPRRTLRADADGNSPYPPQCNRITPDLPGSAHDNGAENKN
jgi:hypothetical protein